MPSYMDSTLDVLTQIHLDTLCSVAGPILRMMRSEKGEVIKHENQDTRSSAILRESAPESVQKDQGSK